MTLLLVIHFFIWTTYTGTPEKRYKVSTRYKELRSKISPDSDVTVVSAFFDLGPFSKRTSHRRDPEMYYKWMEVIRYLRNPVIFFAESEEVINKMTEIRNTSLETTKILKINRTVAWPFHNLKTIERIFRSKAYSKTNFTSIYPIYTCINHAKYYVMKLAAEENYFHTKYIMWLDVGYFRRRKSTTSFYLSIPEGFDKSRIAVTQVFPNKTFDVVPERILKSRGVIVAGGLFFGERHQVIKYATFFEKAVNYFLQMNLTNTDEQIVYAMYSKTANAILKPEVELQLYKAKKDKDWFYLGYRMLHES